MAPSTKPAGRSIADFPDIAAAQQRFHDLCAKYNAARELLTTIQVGRPKPTAIRDQDHVDALLAGEEPDALDLEAVKDHERRVREQEKTVDLLHRAIEQQERIVNELRGQASAVILRERRAELAAKSRATIAAILRMLRAHEEEQAFRSALDQQGIVGATTVWAPSFWQIYPLGAVDEPDSGIVRLLREAQGMGILTDREVATIRAGGAIPEA